MTAERYPGLRILDQSGHWDEATRDVIMDRVHNVPPVRHFSGVALRTLEALCECIVPQVDRPADRRVAIAPWIDAQLEHAAPEGFRFDDMRRSRSHGGRGLEGLNESAVALFGRAFPDLDADGRRTILEAVRAGTADGETWQQIPARRWWIYVALREILGVYFAHPGRVGRHRLWRACVPARLRIAEPRSAGVVGTGRGSGRSGRGSAGGRRRSRQGTRGRGHSTRRQPGHAARHAPIAGVQRCLSRRDR